MPERFWFWIIAVVAAVLILAVIVFLMKKFLNGPDYKKTNRLDGKVVIITGCNRGIGRECALELAKRGARIYMACRDYEKCEAARLDIIKASNNSEVFNRTLDLSSMQSVRKFASQFLKEEARLDILINNAAILSKKRQQTSDNFELQLATNYLGHFLMTQLLLERLKETGPSRIIVVTSAPYLWPMLNKQDLNSVMSYWWPKAFLQSKFCNTLYALKLNEILQDIPITVNCFYPGLVRTDLLYNSTWCLFHPLLKLFAKSPRKGAQTALYLALDPDLESKSGGFYHNMSRRYVPSWSRNPDVAHWLWQESRKMLGLDTV